MKNNHLSAASDKQNIISFHINSSSGIGGLETLMHSFHEITSNLNINYIELYLRNDFGKHQNINKNVTSIKLKEPKSKSGEARLIERQNNTKDILEVYGTNNIIILFSPYYLSFFNKKSLKDNKVILIQSNKINILYNEFIDLPRLNLVDIFTVYTPKDKYLLSEIIPKSKIKIIPRGCKLHSAKSYIYKGKKLVSISRIREEQKNFEGMIKIMKFLPKGYSLDIYGEGKEEEINSLKNKIKNYNNIKFKGVTLDVKNILNQYSIFIMTSHFEGFGQTLIEARSQGIPSIVYNTFDAADWVVKHEKTGYLVEPYNAKQFAEKIEALCNNLDLYNEMSKKCLFYAKETDNEVIEEQWKETFLELLNN